MNNLIPVVAVKVVFTRHAIVYDVEYQQNSIDTYQHFQFLVAEDIQNKDLVCKSNYIHNNKVCFIPINVTPQYYQAIKEKIIYNYEELMPDLNDIYVEGDIIGYASPLVTNFIH